MQMSRFKQTTAIVKVLIGGNWILFSINLAKNAFSYILGDFFKNSSGHPAHHFNDNHVPNCIAQKWESIFIHKNT
jgi:hypothetical protein